MLNFQELIQPKQIKSKKFILILQGPCIYDREQINKNLKNNINGYATIITIRQVKQMSFIQFHLCQRKQLSRKKVKRLVWGNKNSNGIIVPFQKHIFETWTSGFDNQWPINMIKKSYQQIIEGKKTVLKFVKENPIFFPKLKSLTDSQSLITKQKPIEFNFKFNKKRGYWLYGTAGSGKTTFAINWLGQNYFVKDMFNNAYDGYKTPSSILFDEMNPENSKKHLSQLKNIVNVTHATYNIKYGTAIIYPKKVAVTTQYRLNQLVADEQLKEALRKRFFFFQVTRQKTFSQDEDGNLIEGEIRTILKILDQ